MLTFDRYLLRLFVKVLLVCFISITGLYIVIDTFNNLDEFLGYGRQEGSLVAVLTDYYSARIPWFFDRTSSLLTLIAAMFAITWLQRTQELTALLAAGISKGRVIRVLVVAAVAISLLASLNRELVIPSLREKLTRNAQDWHGEQARAVEPVRDNQNGILINGGHTLAGEQRIDSPAFFLDHPGRGFGRQLLADSAYYQAPSAERPGGYLLTEVQQPVEIGKLAPLKVDGRPVILTPRDTHWLKPNQCFVVSDVGFEQLAGGSQWRQLSSTPELMAGLRNPSLDFGLEAKVTIHSRIVQPLLDVTLFFLGLPLVLTRGQRNVFVAAGSCLLVVLVFLMVVMACQALGNRGYLLSPALASWLPLILFVPSATAAAHPVFE